MTRFLLKPSKMNELEEAIAAVTARLDLMGLPIAASEAVYEQVGETGMTSGAEDENGEDPRSSSARPSSACRYP